MAGVETSILSTNASYAIHGNERIMEKMQGNISLFFNTFLTGHLVFSSISFRHNTDI